METQDWQKELANIFTPLIGILSPKRLKITHRATLTLIKQLLSEKEKEYNLKIEEAIDETWDKAKTNDNLNKIPISKAAFEFINKITPSIINELKSKYINP